MIILAGAALVAYFALGVWSPWKESDYPGLWLILTAGLRLRRPLLHRSDVPVSSR